MAEVNKCCWTSITFQIENRRQITNALAQCLRDKHIPFENMVGFCADTCNVMLGSKQSLSQLIAQNHPWVVRVKCSCHTIHLCASHAASELPKSVEDRCRNVFAHFSMSSKRQGHLAKFQEYFESEKHRIIRPGVTRWLSMQACVDGLQEQYDTLTRYFELQVFEDPTHTNDAILTSFRNQFTRAYLEFLSHNLQRLVSFNLLFQSKTPALHKLEQVVKSLLRNVCGDFMNIHYVRQNEPLMMDLNDERNCVSLTKVYMGARATITIASVTSDIGEQHPDVQQFYLTCQSYLIKLVTQIQKRFTDVGQYGFMAVISPSIAYNLSVPSLAGLYQKLAWLKNVVKLEEADPEWRSQATENGLSDTMGELEYWQQVKKYKTVTGNAKYPKLAIVVGVLLSLPHSNASVERVFSQLKLIKTDHRTALKEESLFALMTTRLETEKANLPPNRTYAAALQPTNVMLHLHKKMKANANNDEARALREEFLFRERSLKIQGLDIDSASPE